MKHLLSMVAVMVGATTLFGNEACCAAVNTLTEQERQDGWRLLWDGKSGDGWRSIKNENFPAKGWEIANGELTVLPKNAGGGAGDLITRETYSSFILKVDFRLTQAANSGIKYFFDPKRNGGTTLEYQVLDAKHPDATKGRDGNRTVASLYDVMPAAGAKPKPVGEWNTAMIVSNGRQVEHWLNGEKVLAFERGSDAFRKAVALSKFNKHPNWGEQEAGHILLQDHQDRVSYRNIKIKVLK
ncbi:MAG: hypothetical protein BWX70_02947 [Verrucomicrobia bacterium ADurb.Bin070]|nr:MAG: hypothetical protein BWX70_02947 [Verrucomicrobia bacterium ADurb.Bin070]